MMNQQKIQLCDGRALGYEETGDPQGKPVFFFHGTPGSRKMRHPDESIAKDLHARIITVDRPGFGLSDPQPERTFLTWPDDISQLADHLGITDFHIVAFSGGGPYALACAYQLKNRVRSVALMSSMGPVDFRTSRRWNWPLHFIFSSAKHFPWGLQRFAVFVVRKARQNFDRAFEIGVRKLPACDREVILQNTVRNIFRESLTEAFRQGTSGFVHEVRLLSGPWPIPLQEIQQPVYLWHGEKDPFYDGRSLQTSLPNSRAVYFPEGHLVFFIHWRQILEQLLQSEAM